MKPPPLPGDILLLIADQIDDDAYEDLSRLARSNKFMLQYIEPRLFTLPATACDEAESWIQERAYERHHPALALAKASLHPRHAAGVKKALEYGTGGGGGGVDYAMYHTAKNNAEESVRLLLPLYSVFAYGEETLWLALCFTARSGSTALLETLLESIKFDMRRWKVFESPLAFAAEGSVENFNYLLKTGKFSIHDRGGTHRTALLNAATFAGGTAIIRQLLAMGEFGVNKTDGDGNTAIALAVKNRNLDATKIFLRIKGVDVTTANKKGITPIAHAAEAGSYACTKALLKTGKVDVNQSCNNGKTPLQRAAECGHVSVVSLLLGAKGIDVNAGGGEMTFGDEYSRRTKLGGKAALFVAVERQDINLLKLLLKVRRVDVNVRDVLGRTPLWWAVQWRQIAFVEALLDTGKADIHAIPEIERLMPFLSTETICDDPWFQTVLNSRRARDGQNRTKKWISRLKKLYLRS